MFRRHSALGATLLLAATSTLAAQAMPVAVGDGPLLVVATNAPVARGHETTLHVAELAGNGTARPFWRAPGNAEVLTRLDRHRLLLACYDTPYALVVVDLAAGSHTVLAEGAPHEFAAVHGAEVLHLGDGRQQSLDPSLYATTWAPPHQRRCLAEGRFASVPVVAGNLAIALAEDDAAVWVVSVPEARGREVWRRPAGGGAVRVALSPGGQRLAIGSVQAAGTTGLLAVVDLGSGTVVRSWPDLPIQVSPLSSSSPRLEVGWHDDAEVTCSESRGDPRGLGGNFVLVRRSLATGEVTDETVCGPLGLSHHVPPARTAPPPPPAFVITTEADTTRLLRTGQAAPLASVPRQAELAGDVLVAPDGQSAVARLGDARTRFTLFTAGAATGRVLLDGWGYDATWLPATPRPR